MGLKNKKILITAGPTWVPIDRVRVISNIATGETGILLAEKLKDLGAEVSLLLGPVSACCVDSKIRLLHFKFFDELKNLIARELKSRKYDILIHTAAVSDYRPAKSYGYKIKSGIRNLKINLIPTIKIIDLIKKIDPAVCLAGFKFQPQATKNILVKAAKKLKAQAKLDLVIANTINGTKYLAYILAGPNVYGPFSNRKDLAQELTNIIRERI